MKVSRIAITACLAFVAFASIGFARSILERKMYYLTAANTTGETKFWFVYLGNHDCTLNRKYPGQEIQPVSGAINLSFMSSGYIEGNGYSAKGKLECLPTMAIRTGGGERPIAIDSIDCIFDYGQKVRTITGEVGELVIDIEGQKKSAKRFILTEYKMVDVYGEKELKKSGDEKPLAAIAFSKTGIAWAKKASDEAPTSSGKAE